MAGRYKAYPEYKDSGVEWVGKIPSHWGLKKLKYLAPLISEKAKGKTNPIALEHIQSWTGKLISTDSKFDGDGTKFKAGDILFGKLRPYLAKVYLTEEDGEAIGDFHVMRPINSSYGKFLKSLMLTTDYISTVDASTYGAKMPRASWDFTSNIQLPFCSETEAEKIANFLDHESAKIDTLIAKQKKLIELLKEKRQAVISHAVTKGLNPDAPMKNSGVEWLGDVPEHWDVASIRRFLLEHRQGYYTTESYIDDGVKLLRITDLRDLGEVSIDNCPKVPEHSSLSNYYLQEGDVVFARTGGAGSFGVIPKIRETVAYASYLIRFRFIPEHFNTDYLRFMLIADSFQLAVKSNIHGGVNQNIHAEDIKDTFVCCPPLNEQQNISEFLNDTCIKYNLLIDKAINAIELMKERKTALISAAVTGKIDVRDWQESTYQESA